MSLRVWFPNIPSSGFSIEDRSQRGIGISKSLLSIITFGGADDITYLRRYLDDPEFIVSTGLFLGFSSGTETDETTYMRRYLDDPVLGTGE